MKEFVLLFRMDITTPSAQPSPQQMKAFMQQWMDWTNSIDKKGQLASGGNHLSRQGRVLKPNHEQLEEPHTSENNSVAGYIIILAKDLDGATKIVKACPILNGQNTSVEIREVAMPG
jgi:hypothetical protein